MTEILGFWIGCFGWLILLGCNMLLMSADIDRCAEWIETCLLIPWYVQIFAPCMGMLLMIVGWHLMCIGGCGRYPAYPLNLLMEWMK